MVLGKGGGFDVYDYFTMTKGLGDFPLLAIFTDFRLRKFCKKTTYGRP